MRITLSRAGVNVVKQAGRGISLHTTDRFYPMHTDIREGLLEPSRCPSGKDPSNQGEMKNEDSNDRS